MSKHRTPGKFSVVNTPAGKAKIVDQNGFSIATAPDTRKKSTNNVQFLSKAPEMYELLKEVLELSLWDNTDLGLFPLQTKVTELLKSIDNG